MFHQSRISEVERALCAKHSARVKWYWVSLLAVCMHHCGIAYILCRKIWYKTVKISYHDHIDHSYHTNHYYYCGISEMCSDNVQKVATDTNTEIISPSFRTILETSE